MSKRWSVPLWLCALLLSTLPAAAQFSQRTDYPNAPGPNYIPEGTRFLARLDDKLETKKLEPGKKFKLKLAEDLVAPNGATIPRGKKIKAHVSDVQRGLRGRVLISFDEIETRHGWMPLVATVTDIPGEHSMRTTGNEGEIQRRGTDKKRAIEAAAVGAAVGAGAGAVAGGAHGAVIGAVAGGVLGTTAGILTDRDLKLDKGQQLELRLDRPLQVPEH